MPYLRPYQSDAEAGILQRWDAGLRHVLAVLPTGAGKTVLFAEIIRKHPGASCAIAHRQELVGQMSMALARNGIYHRIIGPKKVVRSIVAMQMQELGRAYYDPGARCAVAGVDTLIRRGRELAAWLATVTLWVQDEAHHVLRDNKWGTACAMFPAAKGLGVTATPKRADGRGLGAHADGVFEDMVIGPSMRDLINMGYLTDYRIFAPPSNLDLSTVDVSKATGDYNVDQMRSAVAGSSLVVSDDKARVVGDVVAHYLRIAPGKLGVTFVPDVFTAERVTEQFNGQGVPAATVSAKTPDGDRAALLRQFRSREILQLVNVDLFGEGFDLPAIEVVSMARPTQSYSLYVQQFGRGLRLLDGKTCAIIIDHVGNVHRHGLPDARQEWTLDAREKRGGGGADDAIPLRTCMNETCLSVYERYKTVCPYCHTPVPPPADRSGPQYVDGDLHELDAEALAALRGAVEEVDRPVSEAVEAYRLELQNKRTPKMYEMAHVKRFAGKHEARQQAIAGLREIMAWWAGYHRAAGRSDNEIFRIFYLRFGHDWLGAQALDADAAIALAERVMHNTGRDVA